MITGILLAASFIRPMERIASVDPLVAVSSSECYALRLVYETPLEIDPKARPYRLVPGACEMPEVSADGTRYVFRMRKGELKAGDAVRSMRRLMDVKNASPNAWMVKDVESVEEAGEGAFEVKLRGRCHFFPWLMAMPQMAILKEDGSGTGTFRLESWRKNHEMVFRRRGLDELPRDPARIDEVRYLVIDDTMTQWLMFLKGELDFIEDVSRDSFDAIISDPGALERADAVSYSVPLLQFNYLGINMTDPVLGKNVKLRQALNAAFDSRTWERFFNDMVVKADGPLPPCVACRLDTPFEFSYDLGRARALLAEAGYPGGIDPTTGRRLELVLTIGRATQDTREKGELVASFFEKIGVKLRLDFMTWDAFLVAINKGRVQMFDIAWLGDYPDAQTFMQLFYSPNVRPGPNRSAYTNREYDAEYEAALAAPDEAERDVHWRRCQEIFRADCPVVMEHYKKSFVIAKKWIKGYVPGDFIFGGERYYRNTREGGQGK